MSKYLINVEKLRTRLNESNIKFQKILVQYPSLQKKQVKSIEDIISVSGTYVKALNTFLNDKTSDNDITNEEKSKLQQISDYYKGMERILEHYELD